MTTADQITHSPEGTESLGAQRPDDAPSRVLQVVDIAFLVVGALLALVVFRAPALGVVVGGIGWLVQRAVQVVDRHYTDRLRDPRKQVGIHVTEAFGRIWLLAGAIIIAGVAGQRQDGLTAAILIFVMYSISFGVRILNGPPPER
ncbi:MAG: hypothetical protein ACP5H2_04415 [Solirubrobacteraceae bacterium]